MDRLRHRWSTLRATSRWSGKRANWRRFMPVSGLPSAAPPKPEGLNMTDAVRRSDKIATLWIEGAMREVDQVCIRSMVRAGLDVTVYRYGEVDNIPDGVKIADGREVLDLSLMDRLKMVKRQDRLWQVPANFSDFFRIFMQKYELG